MRYRTEITTLLPQFPFQSPHKRGTDQEKKNNQEKGPVDSEVFSLVSSESIQAKEKHEQFGLSTLRSESSSSTLFLMIPPRFPSHLTLLLFLSFTPSFQLAAGSHWNCSPALAHFPVSSERGSDDNCFPIRIQCGTAPHRAVLSIGNFSFSLLARRFTSFLVSLLNTSSSTRHVCHMPTSRIDLSPSPFYFPDTTCNNLFLLRPVCSSLRAPHALDCNLSTWQSGLLHDPTHLLHGCQNRSFLVRRGSAPCSRNITAELTRFLRSGIQLAWPEEEPSPYLSVKDKNSSDPDSPWFLCFKTKKPNASGDRRAAIIASFFAFASLLILAVGAAAIFKWKGRLPGFRSDPAEEDPHNLFLHGHRSSSPLPPVFTYEELESSTNKFDLKRKVGDGGFGAVYLGQLSDGRIVAVKKLHRRHTTKTFSNEVLILSSIDHPNLVRLHGYCCDRRGLLLVYDYVPNGTLADHLHGSRSRYKKGSLTWPVRVEMALQIAMAIEYLHYSLSPAVVHRDITTSNIFVEKDMRVRVGDFGLSRLLVFTESSPTCVWTGPQGTPGYLDPDYHRSYQLTEKSDVYSFGVVLLELVTGMKAVDLSRDKREVALADLVVGRIQAGALEEVVDPALKVENGGSAMASVHAVAELAFRCVAGDKDDRPDVREVVAELRRIRTRMRGH